MLTAQVLVGDVRQRLSELPDASVQSCITSPPYWGLRDYGEGGQIGLEQTPDAYVEQIINVFREVRRVLKDDGTLWLNLGDSYVADSYVRDKASQAFQSGLETNEEGWLANDRLDSSKKRKTLAWAKDENLKRKDLVGIPWRVAFALQADGWWLRQDIIWHKPNPMPESVTDRCTKAHEYLFLLTKSNRYYFDNESIKESSVRAGDTQTFGGQKALRNKINKNDPRFRNGSEQWGRTITSGETRNKRSVWTITTKPFKGAHFAVMPEALVEPCVLAGSREGDTVLDPFTGSGTVAVVAMRHGRNFVGTELNPDYAEIARERIESHGTLFGEVVVK